MPYHETQASLAREAVEVYRGGSLICTPSPFNFWVEFFSEKKKWGEAEIKMLASFSFISEVKHCEAGDLETLRYGFD